MKKTITRTLIFAIALIIATPAVSFGETNSGSTLIPKTKHYGKRGKYKKAGPTFGVMGGTNFSFLVGEEAGNGVQVLPKIGLNAGGFVNIPVKGMFSVEPQLLFSSKGLAYKYGSGTNSSKFAWALNYITAPVFVNFTTQSGVYVGAGPYMGVLVGAKAKATYDGESESESSTDGLNVFDAGLGAHVGYTHQSGVGGSLGFEQGLTNVFDVPSTSDMKLMNSSIKLSLSYNFGK